MRCRINFISAARTRSMFERTASRLDEMQSDDWLGLTQGNGSFG